MLWPSLETNRIVLNRVIEIVGVRTLDIQKWGSRCAGQMKRLIRCLALVVVLGGFGIRMSHAVEKLILIDNSSGLSQATDINRYDHVIGLKEIKTRIGFEQRPFFWAGGKEFALSLGPSELGFTTVYPESLSDSGLIVGYASRGIGDPRGAMEACVWDMNSSVRPDGDDDNDTFHRLGKLEKHLSSHAFDISDDGRVVVGYSVGPTPPTMVPVVWTRQANGWQTERLPTILDNNPYLLTSRIVVSGNGRIIAACISVREISGGWVTRYESSTFVWRRDANREWQREELTRHPLRMGGINNCGTLVGSVLESDRRRAAIVRPDGQLTLLDPLSSDDDAGATDINEDGIVVGYCDNPRSNTGLPRAFIYRGQELTPLSIPGDPLLSWATSINKAGTVAGYLSVRPENVGSPEGRKTEVGKTEVGKTEVGKTEVGKTEVGKTEVGKTVPFLLRQQSIAGQAGSTKEH